MQFNKLQSIDYYLQIQSFLIRNDYHQLMNSNKKIFREIKRESIIYELTFTQKFPSSKFNILAEMVKRVKDPKKQINISIVDIPIQELSFIRILAPFIHGITVNLESSKRSFDLNFFDNIHAVTLRGFKYMKSISLTLQNAQEIILDNLPDLEEIRVTTGSLQKFSCLSTPRLKRFLPLNNKGEERINDFMKILSSSEITCNKLIIQSNPRNQSCIDLHRLSIDQCQSLELIISSTSSGVLKDCSLFADIPVLNLKYSCSPSLETSPFLSSFHGKELTLQGFNLSSWNSYSIGNEFSSIKLLSLTKCCCRDPFPRMPMIQRLSLSNIPTIESLPSFSNLIYLSLENLISFHEIKKQSSLTSLYIKNCPKLINFNELEGQIFQLISLTNCLELQDISCFRNAFSLLIMDCPMIQMMKYYENLLIPSTLRSLSITGQFPAVHEFLLDENTNGFYALETLALKRITFPEFLSTTSLPPMGIILRIQNIRHVQFIDVKNPCMISLQNILESIVIDNSRELLLQTNLQHIPKVVLLNIFGNFDLENHLGGHEHVYMYHVPFLKKMAKDFIEVKRLEANYSRSQHNPYPVHPGPSRPGPGYTGPSHPRDQHPPGPGYPGPNRPGPGYTGPGHPRQQQHSGPSRPGPGYTGPSHPRDQHPPGPNRPGPGYTGPGHPPQLQQLQRQQQQQQQQNFPYHGRHASNPYEGIFQSIQSFTIIQDDLDPEDDLAWMGGYSSDSYHDFDFKWEKLPDYQKEKLW